MEYKQLLKEYWDNLGIDNQKGDDMRKARTDFINTLKVMYGKTKFPKKTYCEEFNTTRDLTEDFEDETLITGITTLGAATFSGGNLVLAATDSGFAYENNLDSLDSFVISLTQQVDFGSPTSLINVSIDNQLGENLYNDIQVYTADGDYTFTPGLTNQCNFIVTVTITLDTGALSVSFSEAVFTFAKHSIVLPADLIVPLGITFVAESGRELATSEILLKEYNAWIPFRFTNPDGNTSEITDPRERYVTRENFLYDRTVGYLFVAEPDGVTLWWKPAIKGKVTLTYSTLPTLAIEEGQFNNALEAFSDCLVAGATWRGLRRKLRDTETLQNELALSSLTLEIRDFKNEFNGRMKDWVEFTKSRATTVVIEPFDFLNDSEMLRI